MTELKWRVAGSLLTLRDQVNKAYPDRSKESDGTIGDLRHQNEKTSDHNPWVVDSTGMHVVTALDITHDPVDGVDSYLLADRLRLSRDPRIKYIISNRRIASYDHGWTWRKYNGTNAHDHHCHISVRDSESLYDKLTPWKGVVIESMVKSKIGNVQIAQGLLTTTGLGGGALSLISDNADQVQHVSNVMDSTGNIVAQTSTIVKTVPMGFWHSIGHFVISPMFLGCALFVSLALCAATWYYRWQMKRDGIA